jgi:hypothetical protein
MREASVVLPVRWTAFETVEVARGRGRPSGEREKIKSSRISVCSEVKFSAAHVDDSKTTLSIICESAGDE